MFLLRAKGFAWLTKQCNCFCSLRPSWQPANQRNLRLSAVVLLHEFHSFSPINRGLSDFSCLLLVEFLLLFIQHEMSCRQFSDNLFCSKLCLARWLSENFSLDFWLLANPRVHIYVKKSFPVINFLCRIKPRLIKMLSQLL